MTELSAQQTLISTASFNVALVIMVIGVFWLGVFVLRYFGVKVGYSVSALGLTLPKQGILKSIGLGLLVGFGTLVVSAPLNALTAFVLDRLGYSTTSNVQQPFMQGLQEWVRDDPTLAVPLIVGVVVILGPAVEELVFRGGLFNGLRSIGRILTANLKLENGSPSFRMIDRLWFVLAAGLPSVFFALLHLEPVILPTIVVLAFGLCWLFERTGSLLSCFVAHACFNSLATSVIVLSGLDIIRLPV